MHQLQPLALYLLRHDADGGTLLLLVLREEHQPSAVSAFLRHGDALQQDELMRYLHHDAGSVAVVAYLGTTVAHVLQHAQGLVYQLVAFVAMNVDHHAYATGIVFMD